MVLLRKTSGGRAKRVVAYNGHRLRTPTNTENMVLLRKTSGGRAKRVVAYNGHRLRTPTFLKLEEYLFGGRATRVVAYILKIDIFIF